MGIIRFIQILMKQIFLKTSDDSLLKKQGRPTLKTKKSSFALAGNTTILSSCYVLSLYTVGGNVN